jgi:hypothetical protein
VARFLSAPSGQELQNASDTSQEATMPIRSPAVLLFGLAVMALDAYRVQ